jgi:hypothetical protein
MRVHVFSGFVIDVAGEWFYITAGHMLRDIRKALDSGSTFDVWRFGDQTAGNRFSNTAVPYDFDFGGWCVLEDAAAGLDYAAVHVADFYRQQLEAGAVLPIGKHAWGDHVTEHDHWALVGIPKESVSYDGETMISARFVMVPLTPVEPPPLARHMTENQFFAKLADDSEGVVKEIVGMSGGPIVSLRHVAGAWKYSVIGVQSAWYPSDRVVAACPFSSFARALEPIVEEALDRLQRGDHGATKSLVPNER